MTSPRVHAIMATLLAGIYIALAVNGSAHKSATYDELAHVTGGYAYWTLGDYRIQPENGNWAQRIVAAPVVLTGAQFPSLDQEIWKTSNFWALSDQFFYTSGNDADRMLRRARLMVALVGGLLCLGVFVWSRRLWGHAGAWVSLILVTFSPTMLAHGGLATSDIIAATFLLGATWAIWNVLNTVTPRTVAVSIIATGGAFLSKYSAIVLIPVAITLLVIRLTRGPRRARTLLGVTAAQVVGVLVLIWASYGFRYSAFNPELPPATQFIDPWSEVLDQSSAVGRVAGWARRYELLPEAYLYGTATVDAYSRNRSAFLNGEVSQSGGWRWFFPYAALVKASLPALLLIVVTPVLVVLGRRRARARGEATPPLPVHDLMPLLVFIGWYWAMAIASRLNIGHRHLIPVIVATAILLGAAGEPISRFRRLTTVER